jgi:hypothetical protein
MNVSHTDIRQTSNHDPRIASTVMTTTAVTTTIVATTIGTAMTIVGDQATVTSTTTTNIE